EFEQQVINSNTPVLVDFSADWCGPCKQLAPILDQVEGDIGTKVKIFKMNVDSSPETPTKFNVRGVPTMILYKNGEVVDSKVGVVDKPTLISWIEEKVG
ncbi:MAG: thioredoxin, partial [Pseudomonadota bacterium]